MFSSGWYFSKARARFEISDTKLDVPVVTLSTQDNVKLLKQLEFGFQRKINWNKYLSKTAKEAQNRDLDFLIDANRLLVKVISNNIFQL